MKKKHRIALLEEQCRILQQEINRIEALKKPIVLRYVVDPIVLPSSMSDLFESKTWLDATDDAKDQVK